MNKEAIIKLLETEQMTPQKSKGQNFLIDDDVSKKIVSFLKDNEHVLEIGPGLGALTKHLIEKSEKLTLVEIDRGYVRVLNNLYPDIQIENKDFLKYDVPRETTSVISNIPYYITTKIIERVILRTERLQRFVFMVEAALRERLFAKPKTKEYGPLAILLTLTGTLSEKMIVTKDKFYPMPHVNSAVFIFDRKEVNFNPSHFYMFVKKIFLNRRKTLAKNLKAYYPEIDINNAFVKNGLLELVRVEELPPEMILRIYQDLMDKGDQSE